MAVGVGIDPGPSTGLSVLVWSAETRSWVIHTFQCIDVSLPFLLEVVIDRFEPDVISVEEFEVRRGSGGTAGKDADRTKQVRYWSEHISVNKGVKCVIRKSGDVKPWATDKRLEKIGFPLGAKFKDARDSARHAMFTMVKLGMAPDPLR